MQRTLVVVCTALTLSACGDEDGGDGGNTPQTNQTPVAQNLCTDVRRAEDVTLVTFSLPASDLETAPEDLRYELPETSSGAHLRLQDAGWGDTAYEATYQVVDGAPWGTHTITYTVTDADGATGTGEVRVILQPRIMPLGDSITTGKYDGNTDPAGYRERLWHRLAADSYKVDFVGGQTSGTNHMDRDHEGHNGYQTGDLLADQGLNQWLDQHPTDLILLHIGTNDLNARKTPDQVYQGIQEILNSIRDWAAAEPSVGRAEVLLAQIIGADEPSTFTNTDVLRLNRDLLPQFERDGVKLVDQYAALDRDGDWVPDADLYANELHPNRDGYDAMADAWYGKLVPVLAGARCPAPL